MPPSDSSTPVPYTIETSTIYLTCVVELTHLSPAFYHSQAIILRTPLLPVTQISPHIHDKPREQSRLYLQVKTEKSFGFLPIATMADTAENPAPLQKVDSAVQGLSSSPPKEKGHRRMSSHAAEGVYRIEDLGKLPLRRTI